MFRMKVAEKITTHFYVQSFFLNRAVYEIMWKNTAERDTPKITIRRIRINICLLHVSEPGCQPQIKGIQASPSLERLKYINSKRNKF